MSKKLSSSPERHTFQKNAYLERCAEEGKDPNPEYVAMYEEWQEEDQKWADQEHNNDLEYDLRSTDWIVAKVRANDAYAQNIYAALCNMQWQRIDVWPVLKDETWSCSWRSAGGVVADLCGKGDYIDWYCSGIRGDYGDDDDPTVRDLNYVPEGTVTDEVREDFKKLGWTPVPWPDEQ